MKSNRGIANIAVIVVVLLLLAAGAGFYLWQQTKLPAVPAGEATPPPAPSGVEGPAPEVVATTTDIDTTNWKTYRNDQYGFEFKYPEELVAKTDDRADSPVTFIQDESGANLQLVWHEITPPAERHLFLLTIDNRTPETIFERIKTILLSGFDSSWDVRLEKSKIQLSGAQADRFVAKATVKATGKEVKVDTYVVVPYPPYTYTLNIPSFTLPDEAQRVADQILSTFKFIK